MPSFFRIFMLLIFLCLLSVTSEARTWTDATGKSTLQAELVQCKDGWVQLKMEDGTLRSIPVVKLSADDRAYIADWIAAKKAAAQPEIPQVPDKVDSPAPRVVGPAGLTEAQLKEKLKDVQFEEVDPLPPASSAIRFAWWTEPQQHMVFGNGGSGMQVVPVPYYCKIGFRDDKVVYVISDGPMLNIDRFFVAANELFKTGKKPPQWKPVWWQLDLFPPLGKAHTPSSWSYMGSRTQGNTTTKYFKVGFGSKIFNGLINPIQQSSELDIYRGFSCRCTSSQGGRVYVNGVEMKSGIRYMPRDANGLAYMPNEAFVAVADVFWEWTLQKIADQVENPPNGLSYKEINEDDYERSLLSFVAVPSRLGVSEDRFLFSFFQAAENEKVSMEVLINAGRRVQEITTERIKQIAANVPQLVPIPANRPYLPFSIRIADWLKNGKLSLETRVRLVEILAEIGDPKVAEPVHAFLDTINEDNVELRDRITAALEKIKAAPK